MLQPVFFYKKGRRYSNVHFLHHGRFFLIEKWVAIARTTLRLFFVVASVIQILNASQELKNMLLGASCYSIQ